MKTKTSNLDPMGQVSPKINLDHIRQKNEQQREIQAFLDKWNLATMVEFHGQEFLDQWKQFK